MTHDVYEVREFIKSRDNYYIAGHINPDGDTIGACLGLGLALEKIGKNVRVLLDPYHSRFNLIPGKHLLYEKTVEKTDFSLICVDCADTGRLEARGQKLAKELHPYSLCIDHHFSNTHFAKYNYVDGTASSACEMVYRILNNFIEIDRDIATALYSGMVTDTGGFRHASTSQETLRTTAHLTAVGIPFPKIYRELINLRTYTEIKLLARVLDACRRSEDAGIVHACVPLSMLKGFDDTPDATIADLEGVAEFMLNIRRANVSLLVYEREDGQAKISLRSRNVNVGAIAQQFGGGGHRLAAGASIEGDIFEICDKVLSSIHQALRGENI